MKKLRWLTQDGAPPTALATIDKLGRRSPDWTRILMSGEYKRVAIADLCSPSGVLPSQLLVAAKDKQQAYCPLEEALRNYTDQGWAIHIFPVRCGVFSDAVRPDPNPKNSYSGRRTERMVQ
jgi:hypothetical protein